MSQLDDALARIAQLEAFEAENDALRKHVQSLESSLAEARGLLARSNITLERVNDPMDDGRVVSQENGV